MKYVALLRGINVGKSVQVPMVALKKHFEELGMAGVTTYLNTGNVLFESDEGGPVLQRLIEESLAAAYAQKIPTLVKTASEMVSIAGSIPGEWASDDTEQTYVAYLFKEFARPELVNELPVKREYLTIFYAHESLIWNIKRENYNRSRITKIVEHPSYAFMTTRNVNTARKLAALCDSPT